MPSPKTAATVQPQPARPAAAPSSDRKSKQAPSMSHERIAADIDAFRRAGGKVEVLGNTPVLRSISPAGSPAATDAAPAAARRKR